MIAGWLISGAFVYLLVPGLHFLDALVIAASLTPTVRLVLSLSNLLMDVLSRILFSPPVSSERVDLHKSMCPVIFDMYCKPSLG